MESLINESVDLPYAFEKVWDAAMSVLQQAKWNVTKADKALGGIEVHVVMDMLTWTETFFVNLTRNSASSTRVVMGRIGVAQPLDWGIARQHIDSFFRRLQNTLGSAS